MISLVYVSSATSLFSPEQLSSLLAVSQRNNSRMGITGMLMYVGGNFMQALEGDDAAVDALTSKISGDPRHNQVKRLIRESITERQFSEWSMGLLQMRDLPQEDRDDCVSLIETSLLGNEAQNTSVTRRLLESFRKSMR